MTTERASAPPAPEYAPCALSRRRFLILLSAVIAPSACKARQPGAAQTTPAPGGTASTSESRESSALSLAEFLQLSVVLTGFDNLNRDLGQIYLESLQARPNPAITLVELYGQAGFRSAAPPKSLEELAHRGVFKADPPRALANKIITYWYTGIYDKDGQPAVATFTDALAWKALTYTKPPSVCGGAVGYWGEHPPGA